jgi:hypothetical protein
MGQSGDLMQPERAPVDPHETLFVPRRRRFVSEYVAGEDGSRELHLYFGLQEITFDEPELFPWAEKLIEQESFLAGSATTWSSQPLEWARVKDLLEALVDAGIVERAPPEKATAPCGAAHLRFLEREKTRRAPAEPRSWNRDPGAVFREICGRDLEAGYLEAVMPVHRLAHIALDREGRQVGEVNVFPEALRLKIPTEWKTCNYPGSRYRDELPINASALKSMTAHWKPVLRAVLSVREHFLRIYPQLPDGRWKLGDLHFLCCGILAVPTLQLMRWRDPVANGELDPVMSSLFRVTDGVRMVCAYLLDLYERPMRHDHPFSPRDLTNAAERENQYLSTRGVCAGPQAMIDEFVETLMQGKPVEGADPPGPWTAEIPAALDYALRGLQVYSAVFTTWGQMALAYSRIRDALLRAPQPQDGRLGKLRAAIERDWKIIVPGRLHLAEQRAWAQQWYREMFERAQLGIRGLAAADRQDLAALLEPPAGLLGERASGALRDLFASTEEPSAVARNAPLLEEIAGHVLDYLRFERNALRAVTALQREINSLLGRPQPSSPLTGTQLAIHHLLRVNTGGALPYLLDTVLETLDVAVENHQDATTVTHAGRSVVLA